MALLKFIETYQQIMGQVKKNYFIGEMFLHPCEKNLKLTYNNSYILPIDPNLVM
jgi:hypothetical protein